LALNLRMLLSSAFIVPSFKDKVLTMTKLIWHIDRAKFQFEDEADYESWKADPQVFFEFSPSSADDAGENIFVDPFEIEIYEQVTEPNSKVAIIFEGDGPVVSAWVAVDIETTEEFDQESFDEWSSDGGGWYAGSISLGDFDAHVTEDDGGDWRIG